MRNRPGGRPPGRLSSEPFYLIPVVPGVVTPGIVVPGIVVPGIGVPGIVGQVIGVPDIPRTRGPGIGRSTASAGASSASPLRVAEQIENIEIKD
jgi:hypothetical protein